MWMTFLLQIRLPPSLLFKFFKLVSRCYTSMLRLVSKDTQKEKKKGEYEQEDKTAAFLRTATQMRMIMSK